MLGAGAGDTTLRLLELEDEIKDLRKKLEDREEELKSRQDEVLCLSASLLEKEQLLFGAGIGEVREETGDAAKLSREALSRASHNLMLQELEGLQKVFCQVRRRGAGGGSLRIRVYDELAVGGGRARGDSFPAGAC